MILVIDNFDSFTFNLVQAVQALKEDVVVKRNNAITISEIEKLAPSGIIISPGPGRPEAAGISVDVVKTFYTKIPILGVCLGHQSIAFAFGGKIIHASRIMHGKTSEITHDNSALFQGIPQKFQAVRYHSLSVEESTLPKEFKVSARSDDNEIMAIEHQIFSLYGIQFHPESIATQYGPDIIERFTETIRRSK
jgi:anthranilate synthase/aminodeoxychorismate synthase-like glutamine amidotransferase